jgi:hypothetical protein
VGQEDLIMGSKKLIGALAVAAMCSGACAAGGPGSDPSATENTGTSESPVVASLACTPLLTTTAPLLTCGATAAAQLSVATSLQTSLAAQMQLAFANVTLLPQIAQNQVILSSTATAFTSFFGSQIIVPLTPTGMFTTVIPLPVSALAPGLALSATVFGFLPNVLPVIPTTLPVVTTSLLPAATSTQFAAFNTAALSSITSTVNTATLAAATMPLTVMITTPIDATLGLTCSGAIPLGCL